MNAIGVFLIMGLIALVTVLPVSATGQDGNGKMLQSDSGSTGAELCPNPDCPQNDCPYNQTPPRDGSGMQYGKYRSTTGVNR